MKKKITLIYLGLKLTLVGYKLKNVNKFIICEYRKNGTNSIILQKMLKKYSLLYLKWTVLENEYNIIFFQKNYKEDCLVFRANVKSGSSKCNFTK